MIIAVICFYVLVVLFILFIAYKNKGLDFYNILIAVLWPVVAIALAICYLVLLPFYIAHWFSLPKKYRKNITFWEYWHEEAD